MRVVDARATPLGARLHPTAVNADARQRNRRLRLLVLPRQGLIEMRFGDRVTLLRHLRADLHGRFVQTAPRNLDVADLQLHIGRPAVVALVGAFVGVDSTRVLPAENGTAAINILGIVRSWRFLPPNVPQALGLRIADEGSVAIDVRFLSSQAANSTQRPRLRITYLPRAEFALP